MVVAQYGAEIFRTAKCGKDYPEHSRRIRSHCHGMVGRALIHAATGRTSLGKSGSWMDFVRSAILVRRMCLVVVTLLSLCKGNSNGPPLVFSERLAGVCVGVLGSSIQCVGGIDSSGFVLAKTAVILRCTRRSLVWA